MHGNCRKELQPFHARVLGVHAAASVRTLAFGLLRRRVQETGTGTGDRKTARVRRRFHLALRLGGIVAFFLASPLPAQENGRITGLVTASGRAGPLSEAQVYLPDLGSFAVSDADGRYLIADVPAGTYNVRVERTGYRSAQRPVTVLSGRTVTADFMLERLAGGSGSTRPTGELEGGESCHKTVTDPIYSVEWRRVEVEIPVFSFVVVSNSVLVVGSRDHNIYLIDMHDGSRESLPTEGEVLGIPSMVTIAGQQAVAMGSEDGRVYFFDTDGAQVWEPFSTQAGVEAPVAQTEDGTLLIASKDGMFYFRKPDGAVSRFRIDGKFIASPFVVKNSDGREMIVIGGGDGWVHYFEATGQPIEHPVAAAPVDGAVTSAALTGNGDVLVGTSNGKLNRLDANGNRMWEFATDSAHMEVDTWDVTGGDGRVWTFSKGVYSPARELDDGTLVFAGMDGRVYFLNPDGTKKLSYQGPAPVWTEVRVIRDTTIVVAFVDGEVHFLDQNGRMRAVFKGGGRLLAAVGSMQMDGDELPLVGYEDGRFYRFTITDTLSRYESRILDIPCR